MANNSVITYIPPKEKFIQVSNSIVDKYEPDVVGVYCKIVRLSAGKSLNIGFIAKKIGVSDKKIRRIIVFLEDEGYVVRESLKNTNGAFCGWNYRVYAEPVPKDRRSHAGKKDKTDDSGLTQNRTSPSADKTENGKENITISNETNSNIDEDVNDNNKKSPYGDKKVVIPGSLFPEQQSEDEAYEVYMKAHYPYIMKMDKPLTRQEGKKLKELYGDDVVFDVLNAMENYKQLLKNYRSAYKTANNWCTRRIQNQKQ